MVRANEDQKRYWQVFYQLRVHIDYLNFYQNSSDSWDKRINMFLAITSSCSIGSWAIWNNLRILWAIIIAASQVVVAIKGLLPYHRRIKMISDLSYDLKDLLLFTEKKYFDVSKGLLTNRQIHDLYIEIKAKKASLLKKHLKSVALPDKKSFFDKAKKQANTYFKNYYGEVENDTK